MRHFSLHLHFTEKKIIFRFVNCLKGCRIEQFCCGWVGNNDRLWRSCMQFTTRRQCARFLLLNSWTFLFITLQGALFRVRKTLKFLSFSHESFQSQWNIFARKTKMLFSPSRCRWSKLNKMTVTFHLLGQGRKDFQQSPQRSETRRLHETFLSYNVNIDEILLKLHNW